jgi:hypothetical protein
MPIEITPLPVAAPVTAQQIEARLRAGVAASVRYPPVPEIVHNWIALDGGRRP